MKALRGLRPLPMLKRISNSHFFKASMSSLSNKKRLLTGDTPTGALHLGHWVGSLENRVKYQDDYQCYFIIANAHAFSTGRYTAEEIHHNSIEVAIDYLSVGIDPAKSQIFIQSDIPAIFELTFMCSMFLSHARVLRNPTLKEELVSKKIKNDQCLFGFVLYPVGQIADILAFQPEIVPVGADQAPHIEMTREVIRKLNALSAEGEALVIPKMITGRNARLVGLGGPNADGNLVKMSKSLKNAIYLKDSPDEIRKKILSMYTDPNRIKATDKGNTDNNPLWIFLNTFCQDRLWFDDAIQRYQQGEISDMLCKQKLIDSIVALTEPMRQRRKIYEADRGEVYHILKKGAENANQVANETLLMVKKKLKQVYYEQEKNNANQPTL